MHSFLSICMNEITSFTNMLLLNSLNARTDHDVRLNKLRHKNFAKSAQIWSQRVPGGHMMRNTDERTVRSRQEMFNSNGGHEA